MKNSIGTLKQQIKELESNITEQKTMLRQNCADIKKIVSSPDFLVCGALAAFCVSWLLVSRNSDKKIQRAKGAQPQKHSPMAMASLLGMLLPVFKTYSGLLFKQR